MSESNTRVRQRMLHHGFPPGLLPDCIMDDVFDEGTGAFTVTLSRGVDTKIDGFPVRYAKTISGIIQPDQIRNLKGVKAKKIVWIPITGIDAQPDVLQFRVGPIHQPVARDAFS